MPSSVIVFKMRRGRGSQVAPYCIFWKRFGLKLAKYILNAPAIGMVDVYSMYKQGFI